jgi:hypothetical protein
VLILHKSYIVVYIKDSVGNIATIGDKLEEKQ